MELNLKGKVVLVTGGSKGIGYSCAMRFAEEGARVIIASRSRANLDIAAASLKEKGLTVATVVADFVQPEAATRAIAEAEKLLGPIDILVNSAGAAVHTPPENLTMQSWHDAMDAKYFSYIHAMQVVLPGMAARGRGNIVNIIGQGGKRASPNHLAGGAANAALMLVSTGLANAFGPKGIRVNAINPGGTITERQLLRMQAVEKRTGTSVADQQAKAASNLPLRRLALPEDIADTTVYLASERAGYVTGVCISMDGGALSTIL